MGSELLKQATVCINLVNSELRKINPGFQVDYVLFSPVSQEILGQLLALHTSLSGIILSRKHCTSVSSGNFS